jgi:glycosyltransferase involved in cell wall biosynthesis
MRIWISDGDRRLQEGDDYGRISAAVSRGLIELGHEVRFQELPGMEVALFICPLARIKFGRPVATAAIVTHELDGLHGDVPESIDVLNRLDLVIVPTERDRALCEYAGVSTAVAVVPLGIDPELYFPVTGRRCTFLCVHEGLGNKAARANWRQTLRSYFSTFTHEQEVRLLINTWKWEPELFEAARLEVLAELGVHAGAAPPVEVLDGGLPAERMRDLYQRAWLFIENTNHEAWSMACTEAQACGTPLAATDMRSLYSQLPENTKWFGDGHGRQLEDVLEREYLRFTVHLRNCQRHSGASTAKLVELALAEAVSRRVDARDHPVGAAVLPGA